LAFWALFDQFNFYVGSPDLKTILAGFWTLVDIWTLLLDTEYIFMEKSAVQPCSINFALSSG